MAAISRSKAWTVFELVITHVRVVFYQFVEGVKVCFLYPSFLKTALFLKAQYLFASPYRLSKRWLKAAGKKEIYVYGETPLTTLDRVARQCRILSKDTVYELGCGSGRAVFWLTETVGCKAVGIEHVPAFIRKAKRVKKWTSSLLAEFKEGDVLQSSLKEATVVYFYGSEAMLKHVEPCLNRLAKGTKLITVSYLLESANFKLTHSFKASFPWGIATIFLSIKE